MADPNQIAAMFLEAVSRYDAPSQAGTKVGYFPAY